MERLELNISTSFPKIDLSEKCLFLGSCFSNEIGDRFYESKIKTLINPFGILFHPEAIFRLITRAVNKDMFVKTDFFQFQDYWFNYEFSSSLAKFDRNEAVDFANERLMELRYCLLNCDRLFLTFGSSIERRLNESLVANCHKQPKNLFERSITTAESLHFLGEKCLKKVLKENTALKIYLTVSPVRHSKEGLVDNQISKANLLIASNNLAISNSSIEYLPVYEYVIDCLRDYSFFKEDLVHPNSKSVAKVWDLIKNTLFSDYLNNLVKDLMKFQTSLKHDSLFPKSSENKLFLQRILNSAIRIEENYDVDLSQEKNIINSRLKILA